jgi:hypothetical protein
MHNHFPNVLLDSNPDRVIGWKITLDASKHLQPESGETIAIDSGLQVTETWIAVSPRQLYQDISSALQKYATDLESDKFRAHSARVFEANERITEHIGFWKEGGKVITLPSGKAHGKNRDYQVLVSVS